MFIVSKITLNRLTTWYNMYALSVKTSNNRGRQLRFIVLELLAEPMTFDVASLAEKLRDVIGLIDSVNDEDELRILERQFESLVSQFNAASKAPTTSIPKKTQRTVTVPPKKKPPVPQTSRWGLLPPDPVQRLCVTDVPAQVDLLRTAVDHLVTTEPSILPHVRSIHTILTSNASVIHSIPRPSLRRAVLVMSSRMTVPTGSNGEGMDRCTWILSTLTLMDRAVANTPVLDRHHLMAIAGVAVEAFIGTARAIASTIDAGATPILSDAPLFAATLLCHTIQQIDDRFPAAGPELARHITTRLSATSTLPTLARLLTTEAAALGRAPPVTAGGRAGDTLQWAAFALSSGLALCAGIMTTADSTRAVIGCLEFYKTRTVHTGLAYQVLRSIDTLAGLRPDFAHGVDPRGDQAATFTPATQVYRFVLFIVARSLELCGPLPDSQLRAFVHERHGAFIGEGKPSLALASHALNLG